MIKILTPLLTAALITTAWSQRIHPVIKSAGGIYDIPYANETIDPSLQYKIVIEVVTASNRPGAVNGALNNAARLINLHAMAGVPKENMEIVLAIHGGAAYTVMNNKAYQEKFGTDNPNLVLYQEFLDAGVKMLVCGQSLIAREIDRFNLADGVKIAPSMLTTMTTYQLKGYAALTF